MGDAEARPARSSFFHLHLGYSVNSHPRRTEEGRLQCTYPAYEYVCRVEKL